MKEENSSKGRRWFLKQMGLLPGAAGLMVVSLQAGCSSDNAENGETRSMGAEPALTDGANAETDISVTRAGGGGDSGINSGDTGVTTEVNGGAEDAQAIDGATEDQPEDVENRQSTEDTGEVGPGDADAPEGDSGQASDSSDSMGEDDSKEPEGEDTEKEAEDIGNDGGSDGDSAPDVSAGEDAEAVVETCEVTGSDVLGPFYEEGAPFTTQIAGEGEEGVRIRIEGVVFEEDCVTPIAGALLDIWQADVAGEYHSAEENYRLRGQILTDGDGYYAFESIEPGRYAMGGSFRPAHIHFMISKPGFLPITTQMYFEGDPFLAPNDPCGGCNSDDETQIVPMKASSRGVDLEGVFNIVLAKN